MTERTKLLIEVALVAAIFAGFCLAWFYHL
jgi:hypothetical protein